jgi:hypothetical protein
MQDKRLGVRGPRPLGAAMGSSAFLQTREVLPQRAWPSPTSTAGEPRRGARQGVRVGHHGPLSWSPKSGPFAGEMPQGPGVRSLWGQQWTRLAFPHFARSTATTGVWPSPTTHGAYVTRSPPALPALRHTGCRRALRPRPRAPLNASSLQERAHPGLEWTSGRSRPAGRRRSGRR